MAAHELHIYRLVPDAPSTDPGWDLAPPVGEIVVRAYSPADARVVASQAEVDFPDFDAVPGDGVLTAFASAVRNDRLYRVEEDEDGAYAPDGPRGVLSGLEHDSETIRPADIR